MLKNVKESLLIIIWWLYSNYFYSFISGFGTTGLSTWTAMPTNSLESLLTNIRPVTWSRRYTGWTSRERGTFDFYGTYLMVFFAFLSHLRKGNFTILILNNLRWQLSWSKLDFQTLWRKESTTSGTLCMRRVTGNMLL